MILSSRRRVPVEQIALLAHVKRTDPVTPAKLGTSPGMMATASLDVCLAHLRRDAIFAVRSLVSQKAT